MTKIEAQKALLLVEIYCADNIIKSLPTKAEAENAYKNLRKVREFLSQLQER